LADPGVRCCRAPGSALGVGVLLGSMTVSDLRLPAVGGLLGSVPVWHLRSRAVGGLLGSAAGDPPPPAGPHAAGGWPPRTPLQASNAPHARTPHGRGSTRTAGWRAQDTRSSRVTCFPPARAPAQTPHRALAR